MYIAITYIGGVFTPGEVLPDDYPADKLEWLIKAGAVRQAAPAPSAHAAVADQVDVPTEELPEVGANVNNNDEDGVIDEETQEIDEEASEIDEEAPEIDVMAGVVKETEKPAPVRKSRAASSKNAPKGGKTK